MRTVPKNSSIIAWSDTSKTTPNPPDVTATGQNREHNPSNPIINGLEEILRDLTDIMNDDAYDEDYLRPNEENATTAATLLQQANEYLDGFFPAGTIYADGDGGLRLEWIRPRCELRLVLPGARESRPYIYHEIEGDYGVEYGLTPQKLGARLN